MTISQPHNKMGTERMAEIVKPEIINPSPSIIYNEWFFNIFVGYSISRIKEYIKHQEKLEIKQFDYR